MIDVNHLPSAIDDTTPSAVAKKLVNQILLSSHKSETILARLGALRGEETVITHDGNTYTIKLPQLAKAADLSNVFQTVAQALGCCQNLFGEFLRLWTFACRVKFLLIICKLEIGLSKFLGYFVLLKFVFPNSFKTFHS